MKYANKLVASVAVFSLLLTLGCGGGDDNPTPSEVAGENLVATWVQGTITGAAAETFEDFSITINTTNTPGELNYSTQNTNTLIFPRNGTFTLPENPNFTTGAQVTRDNDVQVDVTLLNDNQLRLEFTIDSNSSVPTENSRTMQVDGEYVFTLDKQE
ncbi:MAG: hypothetical protein WA960_08340 [Tunicatimonas sp.]